MVQDTYRCNMIYLLSCGIFRKDKVIIKKRFDCAIFDPSHLLLGILSWVKLVLDFLITSPYQAREDVRRWQRPDQCIDLCVTFGGNL